MESSNNNNIIKLIKSRPHSQGKSFQNLDQYLAHLKKMGAQDRPFYEKVGPNKFKLNTGRGGHLRPPQYFTRQQLLKKYGFSH